GPGVAVTGRVAAGPVTPVAQAGHPASRPLPGVRVEALRGTRVAAVARTDRRGYYRLRLRPGLYVIMVRVRGLPAQLPADTRRTILVSAGTRQTVNFTVDTGIR
ncbi:MAG: carboxypeptidase regulatory-like domain-containing protein, partial [Streptosporangiaceae bacterium]